MADIQIHELTAINRNPTGTDVFAIDTGSLTLKIPYSTLSEAVAALAQNGVVADEYSVSSTYSVGDYCIHNGALYRCTTAITTGEAWTSGHWTETSIGDDLSKITIKFTEPTMHITTI